MIDSSNFKKGECIVYKGAPMTIVHVTFSTPTARGANVIVKTKLRNLLTGQLLVESIRAGEKYDPVDLEQHKCSYMYSDGTSWYFMDDESFEQFEFTADKLGDMAGYISDGIEGMRAMLIDGNVVSLTLPLNVALTVTETAPAIKGATAQAQLKPAELDSGMTVQVPSYITTGERIRVDTRDGHFVERVKE